MSAASSSAAAPCSAALAAPNRVREPGRRRRAIGIGSDRQAAIGEREPLFPVADRRRPIALYDAARHQVPVRAIEERFLVVIELIGPWRLRRMREVEDQLAGLPTAGLQETHHL